MQQTRWSGKLTWGLGFFLAANVYLQPGNPSSLRAMDLLSLLLWIWLLRHLLSGGVRHTALVTLALLHTVPLFWGCFAYLQGLRPTMLLSLRWLLALPWGYCLYLLAENKRHRTQFLWGLWFGLLLNVGVLILQYGGHEPLTYRLGLAAPDSLLITINHFLLRNPGLHGHANASAAVVSLILPISLFLYYRGEARLWMPLTSMTALLTASHITSSRSPLIVAVIGFVIVAITSRHFIRTMILAVFVAALTVPLWMWYGLPGGAIRWVDTAHMSANTSERLASNATAIRIAGDNFWGLGIQASQEAMTDVLENPASHNAFLQIAIIYGPGLAALLLVALVLLAWHALAGIRRIWALEALLALHLCGLFCFEEHLNNPTFICLTSWLVVASVARFGSLPAVVIQRSVSSTTAAPAVTVNRPLN
ncbi:MAG: hypothetical protein ABIF77_00670 [bacterium]